MTTIYGWRGPACLKKQILQEKDILKVTVLSMWLCKPCSWRKTMVQLGNGYAGIRHVLHTVLVHNFFLPITVIYPADLLRHHTSHFHRLTCRSYTFFQRSLRIAHFQSLYSRWWQVIPPAVLWPVVNVQCKTHEGHSLLYRLTVQVTGTGDKPEIQQLKLLLL